ncbi:MAG: hypothetical protein IPM51_06390 [Sphingobacteriaceae bacterium]|nr:hypothetical protein [Sphingobacteriaceae bacterium]
MKPILSPFKFSTQTFIFFSFFISIIFFSGCKKKDPKIELVANNNAPYYDKVPRVKIENYVNRLFIDIIGREPFDAEMQAETDNLIANNLAISTRESLIYKLQLDTTHRAGDSSFAIAANTRIYDLLTVRLCEGFSTPDFLFYKGLQDFGNIQDSILGNWAEFYAGKKNSYDLARAANAKWLYLHDSIEIEEYCAILINNTLTFTKTDSYMGNEDNTIKYTFNDLLFRQYTLNEFEISREMILFGKSGILFGRSGHSKGDYFEILTHSNEFYEGTVRWLYKTFLARFPNTQEVIEGMTSLPNDKDIFKIQRNILKSDEYANFF